MTPSHTSFHSHLPTAGTASASTTHPPLTPHPHVRVHFQRKLNIWGLSSLFSAMKQKSYLYEFKANNKYVYYNCLTVLTVNRQGKHLFLRSWQLRQSSTESRVYKGGGGGATGRDGAGRRAGQQRRQESNFKASGLSHHQALLNASGLQGMTLSGHSPQPLRLHEPPWKTQHTCPTGRPPLEELTAFKTWPILANHRHFSARKKTQTYLYGTI